MRKFYVSLAETFCQKCSTLSFVNFSHFVFVLLAFFNFQFLGEGIDFCFDGSKEGHRLDSNVTKYLHAQTGAECILQCLVQDKSCRSVNFQKSSVGEEELKDNCELLHAVDSELNGRLHTDEHYDYYILLQPNRSLQENASPPKSCKDILQKSPGAASGSYDISIDNTIITVFCEMVLHGGGFTFIPKSVVKNRTFPNLLLQLFKNHSEVLLYIQNKDDSQTHTHIQQLEEKSRTPLVILQNAYTENAAMYKPRNSFMLDYLYLSTSTYINGFLSNNIKVTYKYRGAYPIRSYIAFFPNHLGGSVHGYLNDKDHYENHGVSVNWRKTGIPASVKLPNDFFFLTEMHYGGGGCYTSSDRWKEANGTAIGLR